MNGRMLEPRHLITYWNNGWTTGVHLGPLRVDAMVLYAIDEEIHQRALLGIYMRMLGLEPPKFLQRYQDLTDGPTEPGPG